MLFLILLCALAHHANAQSDSVARRTIKKHILELRGKPFPKFQLRDMKNGWVNSARLKGKIIVLNLWFIACAPCIKEFPQLNELTNQFAGNDDVVFLALALDEQPRLKKFLSNREFKYRVLHSARSFLVEDLDINAYPVHIILDREGIVSFVKVGDIQDKKEIAENIAAILNK